MTRLLVVLLAMFLAADGVYSAVALEAPLGIDSDGDRCTDTEEVGQRAIVGGRRDPFNRYDFFDVPVQDQTVTVGDIAAVVSHFGANDVSPAGPPRYDPAFDRTYVGPEPWDLGPGDGVVSAQDISLSVGQFGHSCRAQPPFYTVVNPAFAPLAGARALYGYYSGGSYQIEVPATWNGKLVLWAHGFRGNVPQLTVDAPPGRQELLARGFAWAASSYRENGYAPGYGVRDTLALKDLFGQLVGRPTRTYLFGASMGGHVTTLALEQAPGDFDGGLSMCGVVSGVEILDYFVATMLPVGAYLTGVPFPDPTQPLDPDVYASKITQVKQGLGGPGAYTPAGQRYKNIITNYTGGPRPQASEGFDQQFDLSFFILQDGLNAIAKELPPGRNGLLRKVATNTGASYHVDPGLGLTDAALNAGVTRLAADPAAQAGSEMAEFVPKTGRLSAPLMSIHGTGDLFVPISLEQSYLRKVQDAGLSDLLVQRAYRTAGHCVFGQPDITQAFDDLVSWVETGVRPWGDDLSGDLSNVGR